MAEEQSNIILKKLNAFVLQTKQNIINYSKQTTIQPILVPLYHFEELYNFDKMCYNLTSPKSLELNCMSLQLILRILQIVQICRNNLRSSKKIITKRSLYYQLIKYYSNYSTIDSDLKILCQSLNISRNSLRIVASNRCILFGKFTFHANGKKYKDLSQKADILTVPTCSQLSITQMNTNKIILIEKQSMFFELATLFKENDIEEYILVTAKGYPDMVTRSLLLDLEQKIQVIYYLGDYDVFGFDIFLFYTFGDWSCRGLFNKIVLLQLCEYIETLFESNLLKKQLQSFDTMDLKKIQQIKQKQYFKIRQNQFILQKMNEMNKINRKTKKIQKIRKYFQKFINANKKGQLQSFHKCCKEPLWIINMVRDQQ